MKVAMLIRRFTTTGGAERYAVEIARCLARQCELHVFAQEIGVEMPGVTCHRLSRISERPRYLNQLHFAWQAAKLRGQFDVIHSHERVHDFDVLTIHAPTFKGGYLAGKPRLPSWRQVTRDFSPRVAYYMWQEARQFKRATGRRFIAVSRHVMRDVVSQYPLDEGDFDFAYPGVDLERFAPASAAARAAARAKFGFKDDELVVCFVGTEFERKGLGTLVEAMGLLKGEPVRVLVAGADSSQPFARRASRLGVNERMHFVGLTKDVQSVYAASDIYTLPTVSDPCPIAPLEAMASGLPVIVSNALITGVAEHVQNDEAILLDDPRNASELAHAIRRLREPRLRAEYVRRGLHLVRAITWDETARRTFESYERSMTRRQEAGGKCNPRGLFSVQE
jgi:UDP-glucose:(heptosyl)LPS alpha-1,3-glucosyltransferase